MQTVALHQVRVRATPSSRKGMRLSLSGSQVRDRSFRIVNIIRAVVGRERHACQHHFRTRLHERICDGFEICARGLNGQPAQSVVAAELENHNAGLGAQYLVQTVEGVGGRVAAHALIHYSPVESTLVQILLQIVREASAGLGAKAGGQAVAESHNDGSRIDWIRRPRPGGLRRGGSGLGLLSAACK